MQKGHHQDTLAGYHAARDAVCRHVSLAYFRNVAGKSTWADGHLFGSHDKVVSVDDQAFYIGSENLYPARLQEFGLIVEDRQAAMTLQSRALTPTWDAAKSSALINPATRTCQVFDPLPANQRPRTNRSRQTDAPDRTAGTVRAHLDPGSRSGVVSRRDRRRSASRGLGRSANTMQGRRRWTFSIQSWASSFDADKGDSPVANEAVDARVLRQPATAPEQ